MFKRIGKTLANLGHKVLDTVIGKVHTPDDPEGNLPPELSSWIPSGLPTLPRGEDVQPERADTSRYIHVSREADTIINAFGITARIPAPKGTTYNAGKNAAKRYVERLASNNKERRMLRSRLKKRMHELAAQTA